MTASSALPLQFVEPSPPAVLRAARRSSPRRRAATLSPPTSAVSCALTQLRPLRAVQVRSGRDFDQSHVSASKASPRPALLFRLGLARFSQAPLSRLNANQFNHQPHVCALRGGRLYEAD